MGEASRQTCRGRGMSATLTPGQAAAVRELICGVLIGAAIACGVMGLIALTAPALSWIAERIARLDLSLAGYGCLLLIAAALLAGSAWLLRKRR